MSAVAAGRAVARPGRLARLLRFEDRNSYYFVMLLLPMAYYLVFKILPCAGLVIAFRRYSPAGGFFGQHWVGLRYFEQVFSDMTFYRAIRNNLILGALSIVITYPVPIVFALLLNEVQSDAYKRLVQTISYLPRFLSVVVVAGIITQVLSPTVGIVNNLLEALGLQRIHFLLAPEWFRSIYIGSDIWQWTGWNAIIYIAAITNIDPQLYESAMMDGAKRWTQTWYITIPCILPTVAITFILRVGHFLGIGYEKVLLLSNTATYETADIISTYVYRVGLQQGSFSQATAIGLTESIVSCALLVSANWVSRRFGESSLW